MDPDVLRLLTSIVCALAVLKHTNAITCYSCHGVARVAECNTIVTCNQTENCFQEKVAARNGFTFNLGCRKSQQCQPSSSTGRRYLLDADASSNQCSECCNSALCNRALCWNDPDCFDSHPSACTPGNMLPGLCHNVSIAKIQCRSSCGLCDVVDGELTTWSHWSVCDVTCGTGTQGRSRTCTSPAPKNGGANCVGHTHQKQACHQAKCPVHGGWGTWSSWSSCSTSCGPGLERRDRTCSNPKPALLGDHCFGESRDDRICITRGCRDGGWSHWTTWSHCSASCGNGFRTRTRDCSNPQPSAYGKPCHGQPMDITACNNKRCPEIMSSFTVDHPRSIVHSQLTFSNTIFNIGGDFNPSTGIFRCSKPGVYTFTFSLVRKKIGSALICYLRRNGASITRGQFKPFGVYDDDYAYAVNTALMHLGRGDTVSLYGCSDPSHHMESWTSFSGYLLYPDV